MSMKKILGPSLFRALKQRKDAAVQAVVKLVNRLGLNVFPVNNYYSPLPVLSRLEKNRARWDRPSALAGLRYDLPAMKARFDRLVQNHLEEYRALTPYEEAKELGFGPGYTFLDGLTSFVMLRDLKPALYFEIGSGLSTWYAAQALMQNRKKDSRESRMTCVEPFPYPNLRNIPGMTLHACEVQDMPLEAFDVLEDGDVLFIDSSHIVRIDGDVPFLFLEVLPRLKKGVYVHIHDIPFPYNTPYPAQEWIFKRGFPMYWTEAMLLQAFLCFNDAFEILLSTPLLRFHEENFLRERVPGYAGIDREPNTFSSIWLKKLR